MLPPRRYLVCPLGAQGYSWVVSWERSDCGDSQLGEVPLSHEQEDEHSEDAGKGDREGDSSRSLRRNDRGSDEVASDEEADSAVDGIDEAILLDDGSDPKSVLALSEKHRGPLPHPKTLRSYDEIVPGSAELIIQLYAEDRRAKIGALERVTKAESRAVSIGSISASLLSVGGLIAAVVLIVQGFPAAGLLLAVPSLVTSVARVVSAAKGGQPEEH